MVCFLTETKRDEVKKERKKEGKIKGKKKKYVK